MAYRALIVLALALLSTFVRAETIPATYGPAQPLSYDAWYGYSQGSLYRNGASPQAAADAMCSYFAGTISACTSTYPVGGWTYVYNGTTNGMPMSTRCPGTTGAQYGSGNCASVYSCPSGQGWTLSGQTCTRPDCPSGTVRQPDGSCQSQCTAQAGQAVSSGFYDMGTDPKKMQSVGCAPAGSSGGCLAVFSGTYPVKTAIVLGQVHYYAQGGYNYYDPAIHGANPDTSCDPADPADKPAPSSVAAIPADQCAANQGYASMNGKTVCIDNATGEPTPATASQAAQSTSSTTSTTDGNGVTTTTTTTITTTGDTITKTTVVQPNGDSTTTETGPQEEKPIYGQDDGAPAIGTLSHNFSITPDANPFGAGGCPAPIPVLGNQLSFQTACDAFGTIRPLVIAIGWLIAGFIFVGGLRNG